MTIDELSQMQLTTILPLIKKSNLKGLGIVTVSDKGRHNNTSIYNNDGADFGPDTLQGATALGQYGPPYSTSVGADEAVTYANKYNLGIYYISSQVFSFLKSLYDILNGDIVKTTVTVGSRPYDVAITPDGNYAYVVNYNAGTVSVIQISTNTVTATVTVGTNPYAVAITPDGNYAYVANYGSNTVSVIQISTNTVTATITVGSGPSGAAITPDGNYAYVTNRGSGTVSVIQLSTNTVTATVTVKSGPNGVRITPDGNYAYVANDNSGDVSVIQISTNTVTATVTVGSTPVEVAITPDGNYAYVTNYGSNTVSVIQISSNTVTATITVGTNPYGVAITPDGNYAYVANNGSNTVSVIQISSNTVTATVTVGSSPEGVAITPDGNYAYVANYGSNTVSVIQINSVVNNWHGIKGIIPLNRKYNQDLTAQTNATTTLSTASTISITPSFSGRVKIKAILRGSNNTLSDGIAVALYNGSTSIDSETYTQEGLASNEHTFALSYDSLSSPLTIGTAYSFTVQFAAVTGGTASLKVIEFSAEEY